MTNEEIIAEIKTKYNLLNVNEPIWNDLIDKARAEGKHEERKNCLIDVEDTAKKHSLDLLVNANYVAFIKRLKELWGLCL